MSIFAFVLGIAVGVLAEHGFDVSGRTLHLWNRFNTWRKYGK